MTRAGAAYDQLCDMARRCGLHVLLFAGTVLRDAPAGGEYRDLDLLAVLTPGSTDPIAATRIQAHRDLDAAAAVVLERLRHTTIGGSA